MAAAIVQLSGVFEMVTGYLFVMQPEVMTGGHKLNDGLEAYFAEVFGIALFNWGMLVLCQSRNKAFLAFNTWWFGVAALSMSYTAQGRHWRKSSQPPAHMLQYTPYLCMCFIVFTIASAIACIRAPSSTTGGKSKNV